MPSTDLCLTETFFDLSSRLSASALALHRPYAGHLERVRSYGIHTLLLLRETSEDGWPLAVWVPDVVLRSKAAKPWVDLLDVSHDTPLRVIVRGGFALHVHARRLTVDVGNPLDLWIRPCDDQDSHRPHGHCVPRLDRNMPAVLKGIDPSEAALSCLRRAGPQKARSLG